MRFNDIPGHETLIRKLIHTIKDQRVSHAQLFTGPEGSGKLALAIAYAQYLNCQNKQDDDSCGSCPSCVKFEKLAHPDLHFMYPLSPSKENSKPISIHYLQDWRKFLTENEYHVRLNDWYDLIGIEKKQGVISALDCNDLLKTLSYTTYESEYKIMIIWMAEKLYHAAAPKLLKILEEPPDKTLFILVSELPEQLLPTIISRTQIVQVPKLTDEALATYLEKHFSISKAESQKISSLSEGNLLEARQIIQGGEEQSYFLLFREWMRACYAFKPDAIRKAMEEFSGLGREKQKLFLTFSLKIVRDCLLSHFRPDRILILEGEEKAFITNFSPYIHLGNGAEITDKLNAAHYHIERNANASILFFNLSMKFAILLKKPMPV